jgi:hypothetical protein
MPLLIDDDFRRYGITPCRDNPGLIFIGAPRLVLARQVEHVLAAVLENPNDRQRILTYLAAEYPVFLHSVPRP